eukprot:TRINITY_DN20988_c0_g1_i1.p1 TRINITY_DN20988_c0_g1~~TRINITY_DN20988_c0_g1_i1.p1  ORF type:complete len:140 (-),score=25.20 TRINITY_DN20988_c0_g1_i1:449-868(-)
MVRGDERRGIIWKLPEFDSSTFGKLGPGFGWGVGCGVGLGVGVIGGLGVGTGFPGINVGLGFGAGCGLGIGFGYGAGVGTAWDRQGGKFTNLGRASVRRIDERRRAYRERSLPPIAEEVKEVVKDLYAEILRAIDDGKR